MVEMLYRLPPMPRKKRPPHGKVLPRLNVEVYPDEEHLLRRARAKAAEQGETLHDLVMRALRNEIGRELPDAR
jgi:hypothetical protein